MSESEETQRNKIVTVILGIPVVYDEEQDKWTYTLQGVLRRNNSLSYARQEIASLDESQVRQTKEPRFMLLVRNIFINSKEKYPIGTKVEVISYDDRAYHVRSIPPFVFLTKDELLDDTEENRNLLEILDMAYRQRDEASTLIDKCRKQVQNIQEKRPTLHDESNPISIDTSNTTS